MSLRSFALLLAATALLSQTAANAEPAPASPGFVAVGGPGHVDVNHYSGAQTSTHSDSTRTFALPDPTAVPADGSAYATTTNGALRTASAGARSFIVPDGDEEPATVTPLCASNGTQRALDCAEQGFCRLSPVRREPTTMYVAALGLLVFALAHIRKSTTRSRPGLA